MSIDLNVLASGLGLQGEDAATYAADRLKATELKPSDPTVVAFVGAHPGCNLTQICAGLNTMDSRAVNLQLRRLAKQGKRRPARLECLGDKWFVREGK